MKDRINEHEMTQRMMDIMRGGYKGLITELRNAPNLETEPPVDAQTNANPIAIEDDPSSTQLNPTDMDQSQEEPMPEDAIELKQGDAAYNDELTKMRNTVDGTVVFTSFNIYPSDGNVVIDGYLKKQEADNSGIFFKMAINASDIETSMVDVELDDETNEIMQRLTGYYKNFDEEWGRRVYAEYQKPSED